MILLTINDNKTLFLFSQTDWCERELEQANACEAWQWYHRSACYEVSLAQKDHYQTAHTQPQRHIWRQFERSSRVGYSNGTRTLTKMRWAIMLKLFVFCCKLCLKGARRARYPEYSKIAWKWSRRKASTRQAYIESPRSLARCRRSKNYTQKVSNQIHFQVSIFISEGAANLFHNK